MTDDPFAFPIDESAYRAADHGWLDELDRLVVHAGEPHQRMGTRSIDPADWLIVDEHYDREVALRRRLVAEAHDAVYRARDDSHAAAAETAALVHGWLARHHPSAAHGGAAWADDDHPLIAAGTAIQEDLCVMERRDGAWCLTAALVCFPTHWNLDEKFDQPQEAIHAPVPHYATDLAAKVSTFFDRLGPEKVVSRRNWGFSAHPLLFLPLRTARTTLADSMPDGPGSVWFRGERQTVRRLADSDAVLFTIKVQMAPMSAVAERPDLCRRLVDSLQSFSPEMVAERAGSEAWLEAVSRWLTETGEARH